MLKNKIHIFSEPEETAESVAKLITAMLNEKVSAGKSLNIAISGGSTPNLLFGMLSGEYAEKINWEKLRFFWVDERCVDPTDKESNYGNVNNILLKNVPIPEANIFRMKGENVPIEEAVQYQNTLRNELPEVNGMPQFDLVLLGMGDDGHTASIFPGNLELLHSTESVAAAKHPQTGQNRITLTGSVICNAKHVAFVITGHSKAEVLESIMHEKGDFERFPTYYILTGCGDVELYLDHEAAERL